MRGRCRSPSPRCRPRPGPRAECRFCACGPRRVTWRPSQPRSVEVSRCQSTAAKASQRQSAPSTPRIQKPGTCRFEQLCPGFCEGDWWTSLFVPSGEFKTHSTRQPRFPLFSPDPSKAVQCIADKRGRLLFLSFCYRYCIIILMPADCSEQTTNPGQTEDQIRRLTRVIRPGAR